MSMMDVMDPTGHTKVMWDRNVAAEVEHAENTFDEFIDKGYSAFKLNSEGEKAERLREFDASAERMIMIPQLKGG